MNSTRDMLRRWLRRVTVMHIAHHRAASRYASFHRWFGSIVSGLSALVATSIFASALEGNTDSLAFYIAAFTSLLAAVLAGINTNLNNAAKSEKHFNAAIGFQGLRTQIEEEYIDLLNGNQKPDYEHVRTRWTEVLSGTPALPQKIHDAVQAQVKADFAKEQEEMARQAKTKLEKVEPGDRDDTRITDA